ncbi:MAG: hypothetical protein LWX01_07525 [Deltaproteobacteria bacterium]|nr:hypothetical protein [Deltaproteobacteria bacterium]MDL1961534.1 hypothetical protein [Deltaproteobacteria bacterium]
MLSINMLIICILVSTNVFADIGYHAPYTTLDHNSPRGNFYSFGEYDPSKIILKENKVAVKLTKKEAYVRAHFVFITSSPVNPRDRGTFSWAWPLPANILLPVDFKVNCSTHISNKKGISELDYLDFVDGAYFRWVSHPKLSTFNQIGINRWYTWYQRFYNYRSRGLVIAIIDISYTQPYRVMNGEQLKKFQYIFKTGELWQGSIRELSLEIIRTEDVEVIACHWGLKSQYASQKQIISNNECLGGHYYRKVDMVDNLEILIRAKQIDTQK